MTIVPTRKRNKNTKQRRKEGTLMENINKEKDVKTDIKERATILYRPPCTYRGDISHAQWYFTVETRCFLRWEFPQVV